MYGRQRLVQRLDAYQSNDPRMFEAVVDFIKADLMPIITRQTCTGNARM